VARSLQPIELLLVEDNLADVQMMRLALGNLELPSRLHVARDGIEALEFLERADEDPRTSRPHMILLDLNLPRLDGREVLMRLKREEQWRRIPVLVLSSSAAASDIARAYDLNANAYLVKPPDFIQLETLVLRIGEFWLRSNWFVGRDAGDSFEAR
jgi:two-component system response regulator